MTIEKKLYNRVYCDFKYTEEAGNAYLIEEKQLVNESYGLIPNLDKYISYITTIIKDYYNNKQFTFDFIDNKLIKVIKIIINGNDIINDAFFKTINLQVECYNSDINMFNSNAYYIINNEIINNKLKEIKIIIRTYGNINNDNYKLASSISHEITHAYENWSHINGNGFDLLKVHTKNNMQQKNKGIYSKNDQVSVLSSLFHFLNKRETNAYIGELYSELKSMINDVYDNKSAYKIITKTTMFDNFKVFGYYIQELNDIRHMDKELQNTILTKASELNTSRKEHYRYYKDFIKNLIDQYNSAYNKFIKQASKIVFNLYKESNNYIDKTIKYFPDKKIRKIKNIE